MSNYDAVNADLWARIDQLERDRDELLEALRTIKAIGEGSTSANSLSNIARLAAVALSKGTV